MDPRRGTRTYGGIFELSNGDRVYMAYRDNKEIYRKTQGWALDYDTIIQIRTQAVKWVAVWVRDKGHLCLTAFENYLDPKKLLPIDYSSDGGANQRVLPLSAFRWRYEPTVIR